ncbi:hypothetical protein HPB51_017095 [Rhipicephalus microplus]|uniref:N-acetyltransferase domain-containing protein n=1 Tax=Rhipicephalus microplus TaxID=6941 RepID=A0A9J6F4C6_RHIMP|nr:hypothetical protein HPB51_017095 [Rhipicephalus microplus]
MPTVETSEVNCIARASPASARAPTEGPACVTEEEIERLRRSQPTTVTPPTAGIVAYELRSEGAVEVSEVEPGLLPYNDVLGNRSLATPYMTGSQRRGPMVEAPLQCQIRDIIASDTLALRQTVLRPDLVRVDYRGDDLPTTSHFGAYVDGRLVGVVSAFNESLIFPQPMPVKPQKQNCAPPPTDVAVEEPADGLSITAAYLDVEPAGKLGGQKPESESNELICDQISKLSVNVLSEQQERMVRVTAVSATKERTAMRDAEGAQDMNGACRQGDVPRPPLPSVEDAILLASQANSWRIRGLAVDLPLRGRGVGSRLISTCIQHAIDKRASCVWCVARCSAEPVYEKMGFQRAGQDFRLEGIGQVCYMIRALL